MSEHTPGPWAYCDDFPSGKARVYSFLDGEDVAWIQDAHPADLRLVAAAPDLLEALESLRDAASAWEYPEAIGNMMPKAIAAIKRARGEK